MATINQRRLDKLEREAQELLEDHGERSGADLEGIRSRYRDDPVGFIRDVLHEEPWARQIEIAEEVRDGPRVVVRSAHGMGKDWLEARLLLWHVFARGGLGIYTGPTDRQLGIGMSEIRSAFRSSELPGKLFSRSLRIADEDRLMAFTSSNVDNLTGWHDPNGVMIAISEGQGEAVEATAYDAAFACTTEPNSRLLVGGNPVRPSGRFFEISRKASWTSVKIPAFDHPNIAAGRQVVPYGPAHDWPEQIAEEYGRDSAYYTSRVLAEFPEEAEDALVQRAWLEAAVERWEDWRHRHASAPMTFALDVARMGADRSVLAIRRGPVLLEFVGWRKADLMTTTGRAIRQMDRFGVRFAGEPTADDWNRWHGRATARSARIVVDEVGVGGGPVDRLRELQAEQGGETWPVAKEFGAANRDGSLRISSIPTVRIEGYNGGGGAVGRDGHRYLNRRAESHWNLRKLLEKGEIAIPNDRQLLEELLAVQWTTTSAGKIQIEDKDLIRGRLKRSPDKSDALVMAFDDGGRTPVDPGVLQPIKK
ncbi:MAG: hypothetical protein ACN0LA_09970 [Candidatus Longimicrobiales bacterium M2_2A_002]